MPKLIKIGISSCLLGNNVRYDGENSYDPFVIETLGLYAEYVPVCPETEVGMSIPREPIQLEGEPENPCLVTKRTRIDKTGLMKSWIKGRLDDLEKEGLCGYIFKNKSPSCGLYRVKVHGNDGTVRKKGSGLFAKAFGKHFPEIPVEEAQRLHDPKVCERFIESILTVSEMANSAMEK